MIAPPTSFHAARFPRFSPTGMLGTVGAHAAILVGLFVANTNTDAPTITPSLAVRIIAPDIEAPPAPSQPKPPATKQQAPSVTKPLKPAEKMSQAPVADTGTTLAAPPQPQAPAAAPANTSTSTKTDVQTSGVFVEPRFDAAYLHNPAPQYPALSRRMGEEGKVQLRVFVETTGRPSQVQLKTSSGSARLDIAAQDAVRRWKFTPARRGETTVAAWVVVPIVFNLKN